MGPLDLDFPRIQPGRFTGLNIDGHQIIVNEPHTVNPFADVANIDDCPIVVQIDECHRQHAFGILSTLVDNDHCRLRHDGIRNIRSEVGDNMILSRVNVVRINGFPPLTRGYPLNPTFDCTVRGILKSLSLAQGFEDAPVCDRC